MDKKTVQCQKCGSLNIVRKMVPQQMEKRSFYVKNAHVNLLNILNNRQISDAEWRAANRLQLEKISAAGIARVAIHLKNMASGVYYKNGMKSEGRLSACQRMENFS